jgi:hypothetical protein
MIHLETLNPEDKDPRLLIDMMLRQRFIRPSRRIFSIVK